MNPFLVFLVLIALFYALGKAADVVVLNMRLLGEKLRIPIFFLGIILGLLTTSPEFAIGVNAGIDGIPEVSYGNLLGGIVVLFCLILGISSILNRKIETHGRFSKILPIALYILLPLGLSLKGSLGLIDGIVLIVLYIFLIYYLYIQSGRKHAKGWMRVDKRILTELFYILIGLVAVMFISRGIIFAAEIVLSSFSLSPFVLGIILFSLGTNLPELIVTFRAWRRNVEELSVSNLIGSALANVLLVGVFSSLRPLALNIDRSYLTTCAFMAMMMGVVVIAYRSENRFTKREGIVLVMIYILFLTTQILLSAFLR